MSNIPELDFNLHDRFCPAVITHVWTLNDVPDGQFLGFVSVRLLLVGEEFKWARWTNSSMGNAYIDAAGQVQNKKYGFITTPEVNDVVYVGFDLRNNPVVLGMATYEMVTRKLNSQDVPMPTEDIDVRLALKGGETMMRGKNGTSLHFRNTGETVLKLDDEKKDADTLIFKIDSNKDVTVAGARNVGVDASGDVKIDCNNAHVTAKNDASVKAVTVEVDSDQISLGSVTNPVKIPILRATDYGIHIDPILGVPVTDIAFLGQSTSTKAS